MFWGIMSSRMTVGFFNSPIGEGSCHCIFAQGIPKQYFFFIIIILKRFPSSIVEFLLKNQKSNKNSSTCIKVTFCKCPVKTCRHFTQSRQPDDPGVSHRSLFPLFFCPRLPEHILRPFRDCAQGFIGHFPKRR